MWVGLRIGRARGDPGLVGVRRAGSVGPGGIGLGRARVGGGGREKRAGGGTPVAGGPHALQAATEPKPAAKTIPSRRGKRAWVVYLDPDTSRRLKAAAAMVGPIHAVPRCRGRRAADRTIRDALAFIA